MADTESELIAWGYTCPQCGFSCQSDELGKTDQQARTDEENFERATKSVHQQ